MAEMQEHPAGTFCWVELGSSDHTVARAFYGELFGWAPTDIPMPEGPPYTILKKGEHDAAALYQEDPEQPNARPDCWGSYVSVESADEAATKAAGLGGTVLAGPFDVAAAGRMAVLRDPAGAVFSIWEPRENSGVGVKSEHGALCWNELLTTDPEASGDFYRALFGWEPREMEMATGVYTSFLLGGFPVGGMMRIREEWGEVPPHWAVYFAVDDCDETVAKAQELGARLTVPPTDIPEVGRFAWLADPNGASFAVIRLIERS